MNGESGPGAWGPLASSILRAWHCGGASLLHTPGRIAVYVPQERMVFNRETPSSTRAGLLMTSDVDERHLEVR